jgi:amino acid transporter
LGRGGLAPSLGAVHRVHGTPAPAVALAAILSLVPFLLWAPFVGAGNYYSYASTIGILALIAVYISVGAAETVEAWREHRLAWSATCALGPVLLLWVLYRNVYPVPEFPNNLWPYVALAWVAAAWGVMKLRPAVARAPLPDYS